MNDFSWRPIHIRLSRVVLDLLRGRKDQHARQPATPVSVAVKETADRSARPKARATRPKNVQSNASVTMGARVPAARAVPAAPRPPQVPYAGVPAARAVSAAPRPPQVPPVQLTVDEEIRKILGRSPDGLEKFLAEEDSLTKRFFLEYIKAESDHTVLHLATRGVFPSLNSRVNDYVDNRSSTTHKSDRAMTSR